MKSILVIGIGRFGYHLIDQLSKAGDEILAVDSSEERIEPILGMVTSSLIGDTTNESFVRSLGVENSTFVLLPSVMISRLHSKRLRFLRNAEPDMS